MRIFDPHIHMTSRTTDDYERMSAAGIRAVLEPAFWMGQPRTHVGSFTDYFDMLVGWEPFRASQFGIAHYCALALNPKEANDPRCRGVLDVLPQYLDKDSVIAVGEIGYDDQTPAEEEVFAAQLQLARSYGLPVLVHTPHRDKVGGVARTLATVTESGIDPGHVVVDHLNEVTADAVANSGCWLGFSIYPETKMTSDRMVTLLRRLGPERILVNSAADWGWSDPLLSRATADAILAAGLGTDVVDQVFWRNPIAFLAQSGRLDLPSDLPSDLSAEPDAESTATAMVSAGPATFAGNSIHRGGS